MSMPDKNTVAQDIIFSDDAMHEVLLEIARNNKGICPELDKRIDAVAGIIANDNRVTFITPHNKNAPKVPIYLEGEPGQGKSSLTETAGKYFCSLVGLNFVEEPPENYVFQPNDFYYVKVNLSGAQNKSDFGGMMIRTETEADKFIKVRRKAAEIGNSILDEAVSRAKGMASLMSDFSGSKIDLTCAPFDQGALEAVEICFKGVDPTVESTLTSNFLKQLIEESKSKGAGMQALKEGSDILDDRISYILQKDNGSTKIAIYAPRIMDQKTEYASALLPSIRFSKFKKVRFGLVNFDDVANASANIRNILLEVLQKGRYTGTMDIGNAYVVLSGNKGAEDGTNTMSPMSDAELTRMRKLNVIDRPEDWAKRVMQKYSEGVGDCLMASFVQRHGNLEGIFKPKTGERGKRGEKKTNGRALENALEVIFHHFTAAKHANLSVQNFESKIIRDIKDCCGSYVAQCYQSHFKSMVTEAIPMAEHLIKTGELDIPKFEKLSNLGRDTSGKDFCFRLAAAIADSISYNVYAKKDNIAEAMIELEKSIFHACKGWSEFARMNESTMMTYSWSYLSQRLNNMVELTVPVDKENSTSRRFSHDVVTALCAGMAKSEATGIWGDAEETRAAQENFISSVAGTNLVGMKQNTKKKKT